MQKCENAKKAKTNSCSYVSFGLNAFDIIIRLPHYYLKRLQMAIGAQKFCPGQKTFCPRQNYLVLDKKYFVLDKKYFVCADGQGISHEFW